MADPRHAALMRELTRIERELDTADVVRRARLLNLWERNVARLEGRRKARRDRARRLQRAAGL